MGGAGAGLAAFFFSGGREVEESDFVSLVPSLEETLASISSGFKSIEEELSLVLMGSFLEEAGVADSERFGFFGFFFSSTTEEATGAMGSFRFLPVCVLAAGCWLALGFN